MRLLQGSTDSASNTVLREFGQWVLDISDGKINGVQLKGEEEPAWIKITDDMLIKFNDNGIEMIVYEIYDNIEHNYKNPVYLRDRAIVTPINESVDQINTYVLYLLQTEERLYLSSDSIYSSSKDSEENTILYPIDFLNTLKFNGVPNHELRLKIESPVMLFRNIIKVLVFVTVPDCL